MRQSFGAVVFRPAKGPSYVGNSRHCQCSGDVYGGYVQFFVWILETPQWNGMRAKMCHPDAVTAEEGYFAFTRVQVGTCVSRQPTKDYMYELYA